jgi:adenylosuccinate lyase
MLTLGAKLGRQHAHDVVYDAAQAAFVENKVFGDLLSADPRVTECLDVKGIAKLMDPTEYCGLSAMLAREAVQRVRERRTP